MEKYLYEDLYELEEKHWWHIAKRENYLSLMNRFLNAQKPKILDIGCGTGKNIEVLSRLGNTWGLDSSKEALKFCQKRGLKNITLGRSDKTKFPGNSFDAVTLLDVLEHTDDNKTLTEIYRILKPGGSLVITVPAFQWLWSKWDEVLHHQRRYSKSNLTKILKNNNFSIMKISYLYAFLILPILIVRLFKSKFSKGAYSSDFKLSSGLINKLLLTISKLENKIMIKWGVPFGTSLICVARKN